MRRNKPESNTTVANALEGLASGDMRSIDLIRETLARIDRPEGQGDKTYTRVYRRESEAQASIQDQLRRSFKDIPCLSGIPLSVKDLFDIAGSPTCAGSMVLADAPLASRDAPAIERLRAGGAVIVGRTNMTEFAYSGLGLNPHYGTPLNPHDTVTKRIPGGSSSGAAVSVCEGMAVAAIGSDTGGSVRIPAALCGLVGFKPTAARIPTEGTIPLSGSLDSVGPLAYSVSCCAILDSVLSGTSPTPPAPLPMNCVRLGVPSALVLDNLDEMVQGAFERALNTLSEAGAQLVDLELNELAEIPEQYREGGLPAIEAYAWHRELIAKRGAEYDPRVIARIMAGSGCSAADYIALLGKRRELMKRCSEKSRHFDALVFPTVPVVAPRFDELTTDSEYHRINGIVLRNTSIANYLDRCALTIPCHAAGELPVGLMLMGQRMSDRQLLETGLAVERSLARTG